MDSIDVLGPRPDRHVVLTRELLAEAEDDELNTIVEEAARDLKAPIAMVNLVLDHIQFFKAHHGLPPDLAVTRATERSVSFCQFVVRDGQPFEVTDAEHDTRVPQHLVKTYGIKSYLGMPVVVNDIVLGSICVIDTKKRKFLKAEREKLKRFSELVNTRLEKLTNKRHQLSSSLVVQAAFPGLAEIRDALLPIQAGAQSGLLASSALASYFRLAKHVLSGGSSPDETIKRTIKAATKALDDCQDNFAEIETSVGDAGDSLSALENILSQSSSTRLSEVAVSGWELARRAVTPIGGAFLPDLPDDIVVFTPRPLGVALVATCLSLVAARLSNLELKSGIQINVLDRSTQAGIHIWTKELPEQTFSEIALDLKCYTMEDPTVTVEAADGGIKLLFSVVHESE